MVERTSRLELDCPILRWSDALYYLEQDRHVLVAKSEHSRWLQYRRGGVRRDEAGELSFQWNFRRAQSV